MGDIIHIGSLSDRTVGVFEGGKLAAVTVFLDDDSALREAVTLVNREICMHQRLDEHERDNRERLQDLSEKLERRLYEMEANATGEQPE